MELYRWDNCWPGSGGCQHTGYTDTDACKAGLGCPSTRTYRSHTHCHCHQIHHPAEMNKFT